MSYDNNDSGALFKENERRTSNHPHYRGTATVCGIEYWVSAWVKKSKAGNNYMSMAFTEKEPTPQAKPVVDDLDLDDDIPF